MSPAVPVADAVAGVKVAVFSETGVGSAPAANITKRHNYQEQ